MNNEQINKLKSEILDNINANERLDNSNNNSFTVYDYLVDIIVSTELLANEFEDKESHELIVKLSRFIEENSLSEEDKQIRKGEAFEIFPYDDDCFT
jgi:galactitol-specific phosphotransferase system IIB component